MHTGPNKDVKGNLLSKQDKLKMEILSGGPISCGIHVTDKFEAYSGGIFSQFNVFNIPNHILAIVGWGVDSADGTEFWIGRNSWGTYWGEKGFFRIEMYKDNLGIENSCSWATPTVMKKVETALPRRRTSSAESTTTTTSHASRRTLRRPASSRALCPTPT